MPCPTVPIRGPLVEGRFVERPNRFLTRVALADGAEVWSHLANSGRLRDLLVPGRRVWLRPEADLAGLSTAGCRCARSVSDLLPGGTKSSETGFAVSRSILIDVPRRRPA